jgi:hypothetical protein
MHAQDFDFDAMSALARTDPAAFFARRAQLIEDFIAAHPAHAAGLRETQARIDALRAIAGGPLAAARGIAGLMGDHLEALGGQLARLRDELSVAPRGASPSR